jgi:hypothetical protein
MNWLTRFEIEWGLFLPIGGGTAGLGRDQARGCDRAVAHLVATDAERRYRAGDRAIRQPTSRRHAFAEANDAGEGIDAKQAILDFLRSL